MVLGRPGLMTGPSIRPAPGAETEELT
jgi:hypothetical protein